MPWIQRINHMSQSEKEGLYRLLIPPSLFRRCEINPLTFTNYEGVRLVRFYCPEREETVMIEVKRKPDDPDPIYSIQVSDGADYTQISWDFLVVNDPESERFYIDVDGEGRDTLWGRASRNLPEEERSLKAGMAPGQIHKGLGLTREVVGGLSYFAKILDIKSIHLEALFYHNAIVYERCGFTYFEGFKRMQRIQQLFQPGGELFKKLDGSNPFRQPGPSMTGSPARSTTIFWMKAGPLPRCISWSASPARSLRSRMGSIERATVFLFVQSNREGSHTWILAPALRSSSFIS